LSSAITYSPSQFGFPFFAFTWIQVVYVLENK
jgi:hypothetical protein